jgi:transposase InsO family protein
VTQNPSVPRVALQLRQSWAYDQAQRFLIFDRAAKFNADVVATVEDYGMRPLRTALRSPWQNGIAERWVGSVRRDLLLDYVIVLNQRHFARPRSFGMESQLLTQCQILQHEVLAGSKCADEPADEVPKQRNYGKNLSWRPASDFATSSSFYGPPEFWRTTTT